MKRQAEGFTLLEVAIAGAILLMGMLLVANVTRTVLDTSAPDSPVAAQSGPIIDEYLRTAVSQLKAARDNTSIPATPTLQYGNGTLAATTTFVRDIGVNGNLTLSEYEIVVDLTQPGQPAARAAHTMVWKLWRTGGVKAGV